MAQAGLQARRRLTVELAERSAEMTVAGETQLKGERGQIVALGQQIQRTRESQTQLIPIERHAFHLLEQLREIHCRHAHFGSNVRKGPTSREVARERQLRGSTSRWRPALAPGWCAVRRPSARRAMASARLSTSSGSAICRRRR